MFVDAIEIAAQFTRPVHTIMRYYGSTEVHPGAATLFFVNSDGWALTCKHVAEQIIAAEQLDARYAAFRQERQTLSGSRRRQQEKGLERTHGFDKSKPAELKHRFIGCGTNGVLNLSIQLHPVQDVALLRFSDFDPLGTASFPVFASNGQELKPGRFLCRLGFPFPEFTNFDYDPASDSIDWNDQGRDNTPRFPIEGMVTRHLLAPEGSMYGFELSTPGLRGQSGGPAFDTQGRVWGMQFATAHLDLNFDVDMEVQRDGRKTHVHDSALLHVGGCIHVDVLKEFLREHDVAFAEG